uniref:Uncharacterized protein n=1 Tax=Pinguiococcus pyrenoidosus TaxID=172671 RepID=A0A7R9UAX0_9STRA
MTDHLRTKDERKARGEVRSVALAQCWRRPHPSAIAFCSDIRSFLLDSAPAGAMHARPALLKIRMAHYRSKRLSCPEGAHCASHLFAESISSVFGGIVFTSIAREQPRNSFPRLHVTFA